MVSTNMEALIGVRVSRENYLEEGFTLTRPDGVFDFVCNCNTSTFVRLKFGRSPFPFVEKPFSVFSNKVSDDVEQQLLLALIWQQQRFQLISPLNLPSLMICQIEICY